MPDSITIFVKRNIYTACIKSFVINKKGTIDLKEFNTFRPAFSLFYKKHVDCCWQFAASVYCTLCLFTCHCWPMTRLEVNQWL